MPEESLLALRRVDWVYLMHELNCNWWASSVDDSYSAASRYCCSLVTVVYEHCITLLIQLVTYVWHEQWSGGARLPTA